MVFRKMKAKELVQQLLAEEEHGAEAAKRNREALVGCGYAKEAVAKMSNMEVHAALQKCMNEEG